jgi:hypothetical protein
MAKAKKPKSEKQKQLELEKKKKQWLQALQNSEAVQNYLSGFHASSTEHFLKDYVFKKSLWHRHVDFYTGYTEKEQLECINTAFEHLKVILQKKLFDAQCLWRAEKITYPEVQICEDFLVWEHDILNCPFIEPVNQQDIELYANYLRQNNVDEEVDYSEPWQDYEEIKEAYNSNNANRNFPEWYDFHNGRTGNGVLMLLPDIRGEKEQFYLDLHFAQRREMTKEADEARENNWDRRPWIHSINEDTIRYFVTTFENKEELALYNEFAFANRHSNEEDILYEVTSELLKADEAVPVQAHHNWFEALQLALSAYRRKKIAEALPLALEQYQMNIQMGISFPKEKENDYTWLREAWFENLMNGRKLNGEPEDLNF